MDLMILVELSLTISVLTLKTIYFTGQWISFGFSMSFWTQHGNVDVRSISLTITSVVPSSNTVLSISLSPTPATAMGLTVQKALLFRCSQSSQDGLKSLSHCVFVESSSLQFLPRVHIALYQRLIKEVNTVMVLRQDQVRQAPRNKEKLTARLGWIFSSPQISGQLPDSLNHGSMGQSFMGSPFIAETIAMRSALYLALTLGFSSRRVFSDNSMLTRAIFGNL